MAHHQPSNFLGIKTDLSPRQRSLDFSNARGIHFGHSRQLQLRSLHTLCLRAYMHRIRRYARTDAGT